MTKEQFDATLWCSGMKVKHTRSADDAETEYRLISVEMEGRLIGIDDGSETVCEHCDDGVSILTWLNYENCEII